MPVRAILVGGDNPHANGWLETFAHSPAVSDLALCGTWPGAADGASVYATLEETLETGPFGVGLVCAQNGKAPELATALIEAGIPTLVEKPVARTAKEIAAIETCAQVHGTPWSSCFLNRYHPAVLQMRDWIGQGAIGPLVSVEGRMVTSTVAQRNPRHWLFDRAQSGGGILHWLAIHTVDLIRYISGDEYDCVSGQVATLVEDIDVEEIATATFRLSGGAIGHIHAAYALPRRYGDIQLIARGQRGDITWQSWDYAGRQDQLALQSDVEPWSQSIYLQKSCPAPGGVGYGGQMGLDFLNDFIRAAEEKKPFVCTGLDALRSMQFVEGVYQSAESGQRVDLFN